jgi:chromosome segregation protein
MRLQELTLVRYGKFTEEKLIFPKGEHDFHIIIGPNEAGKSTIRTAITELLFGIPRSSPLAFVHAQSDLRIGGVLQGNGVEKSFQRSKQKQSLRNEHDQPLPEDFLAPFLGSFTESTFVQMFCLDHTRLVKGGQSILDPSQTVSQLLFQAAAGIDTFSRVREELSEKATNLFGSRRTSGEFGKASEKLAQAQALLKSVQVRTRAWTDANDARDKAEGELKAEKESTAELERQRALWERVRRLTPVLAKVQRGRQDLGELGETYPFPENARILLETGRTELSTQEGLVAARKNDVETRQRELDAIDVDKELLARTADIEELAAMRSQCRLHERDLLLRKNEVVNLLGQAIEVCSEYGWGRSEEEVRQRLPRENALRPVISLLKDRGGLLEAKKAAKKAGEQQAMKVDDLKSRLEGSLVTSVSEELRYALSQAQGMKNSENKQKTLLAAWRAAERTLELALFALARPGLTVETLRCMMLPSEQRIESLRNQRQDLMAATKLAKQRLEEVQESASELDIQVEQFVRSRKVVTPAEVGQARETRDSAWGAIKTGVISLSDGAPALDATIKLADELVDVRLLSEADAAHLQSLRDQLEAMRALVTRREELHRDSQAALEHFDSDWATTATELGLGGMALDDVSAWLAKRNAAVVAADAVTTKKDEYDSELNDYVAARNALIAAMTRVPQQAAEGQSLVSLCESVERHIAAVDLAKVQRDSLEQQLQEVQNLLEVTKTASLERESDYQAWETRWKEALEKANLALGGSLAEVEVAVEQAGKVTGLLQTVDKTRIERIQAMEADLKSLRDSALGCAKAVALDLLVVQDAFEVSRALSQRLQSALNDAQRAELAMTGLNAAKKLHADAETSLNLIRARLQPLLEIGRVQTPLDALPLVAKSERKRQLEAELHKATEVLEKEGDGLTLEAIKREVDEHDAADAPIQLQEISERLRLSGEKLPTLVETQLQAKNVLEAISGKADGAMAEARRQEALAEMSEAGEEYLRLATANRLLKWAVDRYRDRKQGPMLQRASAVFAALTRHSFQKLRIDFDQNPPALVAYRANNQAVRVDGLSDGTRDQLYLALRIAALELHMDQSAAFPFIADDLFINFDDARSKAGLKALFDLSKRTQVLFLSHQEHLLPALAKLFGDQVNVVTLEGEEAAA